jgi:ribosome-associated protein
MERACLAARTAASKQGEAIAVLDVQELISITDYFVIASGTSERHVTTIAEEVAKVMKQHGVPPLRREGEAGTRWVLLDFVDFVVHVFHEQEREYYRLDNLWGDAPTVDWQAGEPATAAPL